MTSTEAPPAVDETSTPTHDPRAASRNQWLWLAAIGGFALVVRVVWVPSQLRYVMSVLRHVPRPVFRKLPI